MKFLTLCGILILTLNVLAEDNPQKASPKFSMDFGRFRYDTTSIYLEIYYKTKSQFSLGLVIFAIALFLYALTSNPLIQGVVGFRLSGLGPFTMLPDLFTCIASAILLYLSRQ